VAKDAIRIVSMQEGQLEEAAGVMARAFFDEPLFVAGYPDPEERAQVMPWIARWTFRHGLAFGTILVTDDLAGVAIAYRVTEPVYSEERMAVTLGGLPEQLGAAGWDHFERVAEFFEASDAPLAAVMPEPHWYLDTLAVEPTRQGAGIGSALLQAVHALADAEVWPTALLTFRARNVPFYERHGYAVVAGGTEPMSALDYWGFRRAPACTVDPGPVARR
jgi:GNAT superfamily N-acetyltransferase